MKDYVTTDRNLFYRLGEARLAAMADELLAADALGAGDVTEQLNGIADLSMGLDELRLLPAGSTVRAEIDSSYLLTTYRLLSVSPVAFLPATETLSQRPIRWQDVDGFDARVRELILLYASGAGGAGEVFTITPTIALGGIPANVPYTGNSREWWTKALVVYQAPAFAGFALDGSGSYTLENGTVIPTGNHLFAWSITNGGNVAANTVTIRDVTRALDLATNIVNDGIESLQVAGFTVVPGVSARYRITARSTLAVTISAELTISGAARLFFGPGNVPTTRTAALALGATALVSDGNSGTLNTGTTATRFVILLPPGKVLTSVTDIDNLNANLLPGYVAQSTVSIAQAGGTVVPGYTPYLLSATTPYTSSARHVFTFA